MVRKLVIGIASLFFSFALVNSANATAYTWSAGSSGNWSTGGNWSPSGVPGSGDTVTFNATSVQTCTIDIPVTVASITVTTGYTGTISQQQNVTVSGDFSADGGALRWGMDVDGIDLTVGGNCSILGTGSVSLRATSLTNRLVLTGTGTLNLTGLFSNVISALVCGQNGNTTTLTGSNFVFWGAGLYVGTGTFAIAADMQIENYGQTTNLETGGRITTGTGRYVASPNTYNQTISGGTYEQLWFRPSNNFTVTFTGNITVTNRLIIDGGVTNAKVDTNGFSINTPRVEIGNLLGYGYLKCNGSAITVGSQGVTIGQPDSKVEANNSHWYIGGTWINNGTFIVGTSTVEFTENNTLPASSWYNLIINGSGKNTTLGGNVTVTNDLTISSGAKLNTSTYTATVNGSLIVSSDTAIQSGSNVIVNGTLINNATFSTIPLNLTLNGGITNNGILTTSSFTIPANKTVLLNSGSVWNVTSGERVTITGILKTLGTATNMATIQSNQASGYIGIGTNGGSANLTGCKLYYLNKNGLTIDTTGTITKIDNVEFKYGEAGGTHLQVLNGQTITITNMTFDDIAGGGTNITVKNKTKIKVSKYTRGKNRDSIESGSSVIWGVEQSIKPNEGGRIVSQDDPLTYIEIPAGVLKKDLTFTLVKLYPDELLEPSQPTKVVYAYSLTAIDNEGKEVKILDGPITLVLHTTTDGTEVLDSTNTRIGIPIQQAGNRLSIGYWNERYWQKLGGRVDILNNDRDITVKANVSHLSKYAIVTKEASQAITVTVAPNPFTPASSDSRFNRVTFSFNNENSEEVELMIWDVTGVLVRTIREYGTSSISWDGRNEYGDIVEGGVYIWQLKVGKDVAGRGTVVVAR